MTCSPILFNTGIYPTVRYWQDIAQNSPLRPRTMCCHQLPLPSPRQDLHSLIRWVSLMLTIIELSHVLDVVTFCLPLAPCSVFLLVSFSSSSFFFLSSHSFSLSPRLFLLFWPLERMCPWSLPMFFSLCALPGWSPLYPWLQGLPEDSQSCIFSSASLVNFQTTCPSSPSGWPTGISSLTQHNWTPLLTSTFTFRLYLHSRLHCPQSSHSGLKNSSQSLSSPSPPHPYFFTCLISTHSSCFILDISFPRNCLLTPQICVSYLYVFPQHYKLILS